MICKLIEDAGLEFGENISDGNGATFLYGGWRAYGGWVVGGNSVRQVRQSISELRKQDEKRFIETAIKDKGLHLTSHEKSMWKNGVLVEEILYKGWNREGEEVVSGSCLGEVLESIEKWREQNSGRKKELKSYCSEESNVVPGYSWKGVMTLMEHNVNAEHFFSWLRKHVKDFNDDEASRTWWLEKFEKEMSNCTRVSGRIFTVEGERTKDGLDHDYRDFHMVWTESRKEDLEDLEDLQDLQDLEDYYFVHGDFYNKHVRTAEIYDFFWKSGNRNHTEILTTRKKYIALAKKDDSEHLALLVFPGTYGGKVREYDVLISDEPDIKHLQDVPEMEFWRKKTKNTI